MKISAAGNEEWLQTGAWYCIISPTYNYWFVGYAKSINHDIVHMAFLQQVDENCNKFTDEKCEEMIPLTELFYKLKHKASTHFFKSFKYF